MRYTGYGRKKHILPYTAKGDSSMPKVITICTPVTDHLINVDHVPKPNTSARLHAHSWQFGGNSATAIVASARQGMDAGIICAVGDDDMGKAQKVDFALNGVDTRYVIGKAVLLAMPGTGEKAYVEERDFGRIGVMG